MISGPNSTLHQTTSKFDNETMMKSEKKRTSQFNNVQYNILASSSIGAPPRVCPKRRGFLIKALLLLVIIVAVTGCLLILFAQLLPGPACMLFYRQNEAEICASESLIAMCKYEGKCMNHLPQADNNKIGTHEKPQIPAVRNTAVNISVYYETLCPDSQHFIIKQLYPTWKLISSIMNVTLVPYGKAHEKSDGDLWKFSCQHGEQECKANMIQTCALYLQKDFNKALKFINCMETQINNPLSVVDKCAALYGINRDELTYCTTTKQGSDLEHTMASKTENLNPKLDYVPWININNKHSDDDQTAAEFNLLETVCKYYRGLIRPPACQ